MALLNQASPVKVALSNEASPVKVALWNWVQGGAATVCLKVALSKSRPCGEGGADERGVPVKVALSNEASPVKVALERRRRKHEAIEAIPSTAIDLTVASRFRCSFL